MKKNVLPANKIRNIAIIAHIDHGKTTMLDSLLKQTHTFRDNQAVDERVMDSYDQEKERGITIFAKHTSVMFHDTKINIIDTPGHADFSGEVERILGMVDSVLLLVDALEGPMPQTRFVLSKALQMGLKPIVVINKIDRPHAAPDKVLDQTFDLFVELGATDSQLDFRHIYASGLAGFAFKHIDDERKDMTPLFEMILEAVPPPGGDIEEKFLMHVSTTSFDDFLGRQASGRILQGTVKKGETIIHVDETGKEIRRQVTKVEGYQGIIKIEMEEAGAGDIVSISGIPEIIIGDTLCSPEKIVKLPRIKLEEPTVSIDICVNSSPFVGRSGKHVTFNKIKERLEREKKANISLKIDLTSSQDRISVAGKGELHLAVLIEAMRRDNFEFSIMKPRVITKMIDGVLHEPLERATLQVPEEFAGSIIEEMSRRKGEMQNLSTNEHGITQLDFLIPTRGLMGFRNSFLTMTKGLGILTSIFENYVPHKGEIPGRKKGVLVSMCQGQVTGYASFSLQERGELFLAPGEEVYEGMVVGEHSRDNDLEVNLTKGKQLTNVRASGNDENIVLTPPRRFSLEQAIDFIADDEWIEVTPSVIRMRKAPVQPKR